MPSATSQRSTPTSRLPGPAWPQYNVLELKTYLEKLPGSRPFAGRGEGEAELMGAATATCLEAALDLARRGAMVLLTCWPDPAGQCACPGQWDQKRQRMVPHEGTAVGKAPFARGGYLAATADPEEIEANWTKYPEANVGVWLEGSGWAAVDADSAMASAEAHKMGMPQRPIRHSRHEAYLFKLPDDAPIERVIHAGSDGKLDILSEGHLVAYGRHAEGHPVGIDWKGLTELSLLPMWAVDMLVLRAAEKDATAGPVGQPGSPTGYSDEDVIERAKSSERRGELFTSLYEGGALHLIGACPCEPRCATYCPHQPICTERRCPAKCLVKLYPSESERDLALMNMIRFWGGRDPARMERLFGWSTPGKRPKWQRSTSYRKATLAKALPGEVCGEDDGRVWNLGADGPTHAYRTSPNGTVNGTSPSSAEAETETAAPIDPWPDPLDDRALHGLIGDIIRAVEPHSEADRAALLAHCLSGIGVMLGAGIHAVTGDAPHPARINTVVVGATSKGRKGSAARPIERILIAADPSFRDRISEGLSSGEGVIWQVRDPIFKYERVGKGADRHSEMVEVDPGIADKRLWLIESEFATVLRMVEREGNTLSAIARRFWDSGNVKSLTKNSPAATTGANVAITGHVSKEELTRYLTRTELANGFANRFLWVASRRARELPDGGAVPQHTISALAAQLHEVLEWCEGSQWVIHRDEAATAIWRTVYGPLSEGGVGMLGAATSRAEAQVLRISVLHAILDQSLWIRPEHLMAALAVWEYAERSARWIFGDATGDPTADAIMATLRQAGELGPVRPLQHVWPQPPARAAQRGARSAGAAQDGDHRTTGDRRAAARSLEANPMSRRPFLVNSYVV